ncbi:MAG: stage V sporulation protein T [Lachnoclostridium sp.]|jgi:AbrB family transcriptional regulator (stage V sporulation protein T)|nr:stage V sporulation protein T [Lachnoclostridium sp.]
MRATGITRRIDDLGRIVIPKEIRRTMRIREGDPLEIYTDREGGIILKKYSPIGELGDLSREYVESVANVAKCTVCVSDRDVIVAAAGPDKKEYMGKSVNGDLEECMERRKNVVAAKGDPNFCRIVPDQDETQSVAISTIISEGDAIGSVILLTQSKNLKFGEFEEKMAVCGAGFLGRQMES